MKDKIQLSKPIGVSNEQNSPIVKIEELNLTPDEILSDDSIDGASCTFDGETYSHGSVICYNHVAHKCKDGSWISLNKDC